MKLLKPLLTVLALAFALSLSQLVAQVEMLVHPLAKPLPGSHNRWNQKKSGELRVAVFGDKKPFGYVDNDGSYQGYDIELGNQLAQDLGVKVKYVSVDAANRAEYLISNKGGYYPCQFYSNYDERKKQVDLPFHIWKFLWCRIT